MQAVEPVSDYGNSKFLSGKSPDCLSPIFIQTTRLEFLIFG